jgi:hypothetical protein
MKIEFSRPHPFREMKEFHLMVPLERGWISDYCFNVLAEKYGLITLKNQYCFLFINNQAHGVYYVIEDPSFLTLERAHRPRGVLFKPRKAKGIQSPYQEEYVYRKTSEIQAGNNDAIKEFLTVDKYLIYSAIYAIFGTHHDENEIFYLNPLTQKVEPIPFDTNIAEIRNGVWAYDRRAIDPIIRTMLSIPEFRYLRNRYLFSMIHKERSTLFQTFDTVYERIESAIEMDRNKVHATFVTKKTLENYRQILQKNIETILNDITGKSALAIQSDIIKPKVHCTFIRGAHGGLVMDISNQFMHSIKLDKITTKDGSRCLPIHRVIPKRKGENPIMDRAELHIPPNILFGQTSSRVELQEQPSPWGKEEFVNLTPHFTNAFTNHPIDPRFIRVLYQKPSGEEESKNP